MDLVKRSMQKTYKTPTLNANKQVLENLLKSNLLCLGIRITAVVNESRHVSLLGSVNDLVATQRHEVMVFVVLTSVASSPTLECPVVQYLTHVLHDKCTADRHHTGRNTEQSIRETNSFGPAHSLLSLVHLSNLISCSDFTPT